MLDSTSSSRSTTRSATPAATAAVRCRRAAERPRRAGRHRRAPERRRIRHRDQRRDVPERARRFAERISLRSARSPSPSASASCASTSASAWRSIRTIASTADELFGNADLALYRAKTAGRGRHVFSSSASATSSEARPLEAELGRATERKRAGAVLSAAGRPQRRQAGGRGSADPLAASEPRSGVAGRFHAAGQLFLDLELASRSGSWKPPAGRAAPGSDAGHDVRLGVNLSPSQLQAGDLAATVGAVLERTGFAPALLELEVTEDILLEDDSERARRSSASRSSASISRSTTSAPAMPA